MCLAKYIFADVAYVSVNYEIDRKPITHADFESLHEAVRTNCPAGFVCVEPIALYHEVIWDAHGSRDNLRHAIEPGEYAAIDWSRHSVCVDVVRDAPAVFMGARQV